jgi:hypothetical protein
MPLNFPSNPTANQSYTFGAKTWVYNSYGWKLQQTVSSNVELSSFSTVADGTTSTFDLGYSPISNSAIFVSIGGVVQNESDYLVNAANNTISFTEPPPATENVRVVGYKTVTPYFLDVANSAGAVVQSFNGIGDGANTTFNLGFNPYTANSVFVSLGGIIQPDNAYSVSNVANTITFGTAPQNNENIRVVGYSKINPFATYYVNQNVSVSIYESTANGNTATFPLGFNPQAKEFLTVTIDGIVQPLSVYSVNVTSNTITFDAPPSNNELVRVATFYTAVNTVRIQLEATNTTVSTFETTANGLVDTFALGFTPVSNQALVVAVDGVLQAPSTYSINASANTISFDIAPVNNEYISVTTIGATNVYVVNDGTITLAKLASNVTDRLTQINNTGNAAFLQANTALTTPDYVANSAAIYANGAFVTANAAATTGKAIAMSIVFGG